MCSEGQNKFNINLTTGIDSILDVGVNVLELKKTPGYLACGSTSSANYNYCSSYLVKTKLNGDTVWKRLYDFSYSGCDEFANLLELPDSNYLLVGSVHDSIMGNTDPFLAKVDTAGNLIWKKNFTDSSLSWVSTFALTPDNKIIILGYTAPNTSSYNDILLIKADLNGNLIWRKIISDPFEEVYLSIQVIKNNAEYLLGGRHGYYNMGNPYFDFGIVRTDTAGNLIWRNNYGTPSGDEPCGSAIFTFDNCYVMSGRYNNQGALLKIDGSGAVKWLKYLPMGTNDFIQTVKQLPDSSLAMIGAAEYGSNSEWTGFLIKTDSSGNQMWQRHYKGQPVIPDYFYGFDLTSDGGFIITGQYNHIGMPYQNLWLLKTDSTGCDSVFCQPLDVDELTLASLSIFPNPSDGHFFISLEKNGQTNDLIGVSLTNIFGQIVFSQLVERRSEKPIEISDLCLPPGIYILQLKNRDCIIGQCKIIKE